MKINLAGFNVDAEVIKQLMNGTHQSEDNVTPEVISAAYARISRDSANVDELRKVAREEVNLARKSNKSIVFTMGHHSVAEHATLNFDIIGVSRLAIEALESHRLCSYTEKSQRYISLDGDFVTPEEFSSSEKKKFLELVDKQNDFYFKTLPELIEFQEKIHHEMTKKKKTRATLEGWAKEDARYGLSLATEGQLGFTVNARNLEYVIRDFKFHPLREVQEMGSKLYEQGHNVVPSLLILADEEEFEKNQSATLDDSFMKYRRENLRSATDKLLSTVIIKKEKTSKSVVLVDYEDIDQKVISALIAKNSELSLQQAKEVYNSLDYKQKIDYFKNCLKNLSKFDALPREFEAGTFTYDLIMSSSCFAQMKRHRMSTLLPAGYDINYEITIPNSIKQIGRANDLLEITKESEKLFSQIQKNHPESADYCLTNAHPRRSQWVTNLRELYHFSRLREDSHAQWDVRYKAHEMCNQAKKVAPITTLLLSGKDNFDKTKNKLYE